MNPSSNYSRRLFIKQMAAVGTLASLPACCTISNLKCPKLGSEVLVIDPHCHIFNGRDLDIYNYVIADVPAPLHFTLPVVYSITETIRVIAPSAEDETVLLDGWLADAKSFKSDRAAFQSYLRAQIHEVRQRQKEKRDNYLNSPQAIQSFMGHKRKLLQMEGKHNSAEIEAEAKKHADKVLKAFQSPAVWAFLEGFWHHRIVNAQRLMDDYPMVSLFTPSMMDTDSWFRHRLLQPSIKSTALAAQVDIYEKIAILTNGRFLPFLAFDPRRQVEWKPGNLDQPMSPRMLMEDCLQRGMFVGLKLYPPMGYRPADNVARDSCPPNTDWQAHLGEKMDQELNSTFDRCVQTCFCVMAHANESRFSDPSYHDNGSPLYWGKALEAHPNLMLNLAHFGGMTPKDDKHHWREGFSQLMAKYCGVYADVADFIEIDCRRSRDAYFKALKKWMVDNPGSPLLNRLMYGSDFYMNGLVQGYKKYANNWISAFQEQFPAQWENLVGGNAVDFLGLRKGKQRERLNRFIAYNQLSPEWTKLVT